MGKEKRQEINKGEERHSGKDGRKKDGKRREVGEGKKDVVQLSGGRVTVLVFLLSSSCFPSLHEMTRQP